MSIDRRGQGVVANLRVTERASYCKGNVHGHKGNNQNVDQVKEGIPGSMGRGSGHFPIWLQYQSPSC